MKKDCLLTIVLILISHLSWSQELITGRVVDSTTKEPMPFANVFINNTQIGTTTNGKGEFKLSGIFPEQFDLIISFIGYEVKMLSFNSESSFQSLEIALNPTTTLLKEARVTAARDPQWLADYNFFKAHFLGQSAWGKACKITNPEAVVIYQNMEDQVLEVRSDEFLIIENPKLGYQIKYLLIGFNYHVKTEVVEYVGFTLFEDYKQIKKRHSSQWDKNRIKAYKGSSTHFFHSVLTNTMDQEGFKLQMLYRDPNPQRPTDQAINEARKAYLATTIQSEKDSLWKIIEKNRLPRIVATLDPTPLVRGSILPNSKVKALAFEGFRQVIYEKEKEDLLYAQQKRRSDKPGYQTSIISLLSSPAQLDEKGNLFSPLDVLFEGYWSWEKMGEMLPLDYVPTVSKRKK